MPVDKLKFTRGKVSRRGLTANSIQAGGGWREDWLPDIDGLLCGPFGIHKAKQDNRYVLTHRPTGFKLRDYSRLTDAKKMIEKLLALPIKWGFRNPMKVRKSVRQRIMEALNE